MLSWLLVPVSVTSEFELTTKLKVGCSGLVKSRITSADSSEGNEFSIWALNA